ncbi:MULTISPECIES: fumarylacetoacetate hydrolase family protein [unclassified Beijerinckia]|uniref:fumarylacetoacetate hydrolase family protein n=1 Tax=unclassified Beijerinckia TaxID=2638183 RepID=UPI00089BA6BB|nr:MULTISPECIES: fumarylacetoacetate hydrolase family protein [unclassified Beijerinckia]MDH7796922.1 acylpyruvate hydrolase [Beijerinckia sp. GAS462]SEC65250.1 2-keto-4-pentenoate hydratase/2-oxohepta-3-ene-1,7-dioic acid hydratase (catechol pathway) [Beijerinckia sp. 28-YEA-48]
MRFTVYQDGTSEGLATARADGSWVGRKASDPHYPGHLDDLVTKGPTALRAAHESLLGGTAVDLTKVTIKPPLRRPGKIICVGLNYADHSAESGFKQPDYPTLFSRFASGFIGQNEAMVRPKQSTQLDYEGELVAVIGKGGRHISKAAALDHVIGYSIFNDGSIRDFQMKTPQWTVGKNFDGTGAFGPWFVTADELPPGCKGLKLQTRLNRTVVQSAMIDEMVFDVATLIATISEAMTLESGDIIVTGTPSGVGMARKPPLYMKAGDVVEIEIDKIGILSNPVVDEV